MIRVLSLREKIIWLMSVVIVVASNVLSGDADLLTLIAAIIGVTSLTFAAKGHYVSQILMIFFSILYAIISFRFHYWGEMITYLGMCLPMSVLSLITWLKKPSEKNASQVKISQLTCKSVAVIIIGCVVVTGVFYYLLLKLNTPNIFFSAISISTSFIAAALTAMRSSYYGLGYASNDLVLIIMWVLASMEDATYIPVVVNFVVFFFYDTYGFISWKRRENES